MKQKTYLGGNSGAASSDLAEGGILKVSQARTLGVALVQEQVPKTQRFGLGLELLHDWRDRLYFHEQKDTLGCQFNSPYFDIDNERQQGHGSIPSIAGHQCRPGSRTLLRLASSRSKSPEYINKMECQLGMRVIEHDTSR